MRFMLRGTILLSWVLCLGFRNALCQIVVVCKGCCVALNCRVFVRGFNCPVTLKNLFGTAVGCVKTNRQMISLHHKSVTLRGSAMLIMQSVRGFAIKRHDFP